MWKSIFMYALLALSYFGLSTIPFTEVSAEETIAITSGNNQSTTRGQNFPDPVTFTVTDSGSPVNGEPVTLTIASKSHFSIGTTENGDFHPALSQNTNPNGEVTIYVKANENASYDTGGVDALLDFPQNLNGPRASFTGTITDVLYFSEGTTTTRRVRKGTAADTNIGSPVSATHWADVTLTYSLEGTDAALFRIDSEGQLQNVDRLDAEATYSVTVKVEHKSGTTVRSSDTIEVTIRVTTAPPPPPKNERTPADLLPLVGSEPVETNGLTIKRIGNPTTLLSWNMPTGINTQAILEYQYSTDAGQTWTSTGSTDTSIRIHRDGAHTLPVNKFKVRAVSLNANGTARVVTFVLSVSPHRRIRYECPVGWTRGSVFGRTPKALIYELKVKVDHTNRISIYELESLAIYVHPEEGLETLDGWTLKVGTLYNNFGKTFKLTAENSVIDDYDFAHIKNPEGTPIPLGTVGFIGQRLSGFDYRLYDAQGVRVDFGISCYKEGGLTFRLWNTKDPRLLRILPFPVSEAALSVQMKNLDWQTPFFRTQWTAAIMPDLPDAPAAPSQVKKTVVGTWGDLKKQ